MDKFFRWLGRAVGRIRYNFNAGVIDYHAAKDSDQKRNEVYLMVKDNPDKNYIPAIKLHRMHFNSSLREAKDAVDEMRLLVGFKRDAML